MRRRDVLMERVFSAAGDVPDMPPRSFAALLVVLTLVAAPAAGLGLTTQAGAPAGPGAAVGGSSSSAPVALAQEATATAGPPTGTAGVPGSTDTPSGGVTGTPGATTPTSTPANRGTLAPSEETWRLQLDPDGDARWQISVTIPVRNAEDAAAFDDVAADFGTVENPLGYEFFRRAATEAGAETGREMAIEDVSRSTDRVNGTGTLTVSFTWTNFARTAGDRLVVGDGFNTTSGSWLPSLGNQMTLVVVPPSGYGVTSAPEVGIVDGAARWEGPYDFAGREPWIVYSGSAPTPTPAGPNVTGSPGTGTAGTETPDGPFGSLLPVAALAVVAGASAAVLVVYMRREDGGSGAIGDPSDDGGDGGPAAGPAGATDTATGGEDGSGSASANGSDTAGSHGGATVGGADGTAGGDGSAGVGAAATGAGSDGTDADGDEGSDSEDDDDGIDEELLSDEERVERLLERNGGRMKQATIVKETGWSNAKVSQLLSAMAEDDRVDKLRIGRENLISFPDEDVTDIDSSE